MYVQSCEEFKEIFESFRADGHKASVLEDDADLKARNDSQVRGEVRDVKK